jgi:hypothetical protein
MHHDHKLAYEHKKYPVLSLYNGGLEAEIDLFRLTSIVTCGWEWFWGQNFFGGSTLSLPGKLQNWQGWWGAKQ